MLAASSVVLAMNAQAGPKRIRQIVTAAPRAVGRTAENMVTFRDRRLALNQWILMAAVLIDAKTSFDVTRRCAEPCENYSFVFGAHPSEIRVFGLLGVTGMCYATINQAAWELSYTEADRGGREFERYFFLFPAVMHGWFALRNIQTHSATSPAFEGPSNVPPQLRPDHAGVP